MDPIGILKRPKGKTLEFKREFTQDLSSLDETLATIGAVANTAGGLPRARRNRPLGHRGASAEREVGRRGRDVRKGSHMRCFLPALLAATALSAAGLVNATDSPELQRYIDEARQSGMGEMARTTLRSVASITTGGSILTFQKEPDGNTYGRSYQSTSCPPRGDSLVLKEWQKAYRARIDPEVQVLRGLADADSSGFVTSAEAGAFRELIEFGYFVAFLMSQGNASLSEIAKATEVPEQAIPARIRKYNAAAAVLNGLRHEPLQPRLPLVKLSM